MDWFLSGTSDVLLPEGGGRRPVREMERSESDLEARAPYFCERCDESIPLAALAAGRARLVYGLSFCVRCAPLLEEERYQIYFCDRCGVSIPLERIEGGEALAGDGHVYCVRCRRRRPRLDRRTLLPAVGLVVAGALAVLVPRLWPTSVTAAGPDFETALREAESLLDERLGAIVIERRLRRARLDAWTRSLAEEASRLESLGERVLALMTPEDGSPPTDRR
jgi:hypothetical protein